MFILTVDMTTYPVTKYYYIIERIYFIYRMFILFISTLSFLLFYIIMEAYERLSPCQCKYCFILCSTLLTRWRNIRLFYATFLFTIKKVPIWTWPTHSTICSYAHGYPLTKLSHWNVELLKITAFKQRCRAQNFFLLVWKEKKLSLDEKMKVIDYGNKNPKMRLKNISVFERIASQTS